VENLAGSLQGINDGTETGSEEDNIGSRSGSVGSALDGDTSVGLLQGGSIVDTVTSHGNEVTTLLQNLDDIVLLQTKLVDWAIPKKEDELQGLEWTEGAEALLRGAGWLF
jgi:hypothetical protein